MESMDTKEKVLRALKETDGYLSGEVLSRQLGISRAAVWKAISSLREMGCRIDSVTHRGYRLLGIPDLLTGEALLEGLEDTFVTRICAMKQVDSTNNEAKRQAQLGAPAGSLFVAEEQTGGKGRLGRQWSSPSGTGLWCSLLLRPKAVPEQVTGLTLLAGLAVARSIRALTGLNAQIKWPNDVVVEGRKLCGILTEMAAEMESVEYVVVGVGINVNTQSFPEEIAKKATSLLLETGKSWRRVQVLRQFLLETQALLGEWESQGTAALLPAYTADCVTIGRQVSTHRGGRFLTGKAEGITDTGELLVRLANGSLETINSGEVSVQGVYGE